VLHENPNHIKEANGKLNEYWECRVKNRKDEKENLVNKNQKLLKALEAFKVSGSKYIQIYIQ
jgi:hypothetical protein